MTEAFTCSETETLVIKKLVVGLAKEKENEKTKMIGSGGVGWGTMKQC
jgi:hypothetical protein